MITRLPHERKGCKFHAVSQRDYVDLRADEYINY